MYWILFRRETDNAHYFWNGKYVICVWVPEGSNINENVWQDDRGHRHVALEEIAGKLRSRVIKFKDDKRRYLIVEQGEFVKE